MSEQELISILSSVAILYGILLLIAPIWIIALLQRHKLQNRTMICQLAQIRDAINGVEPESPAPNPAKPRAPASIQHQPEHRPIIPTAGIFG